MERCIYCLTEVQVRSSGAVHHKGTIRVIAAHSRRAAMWSTASGRTSLFPSAEDDFSYTEYCSSYVPDGDTTCIRTYVSDGAL